MGTVESLLNRFFSLTRNPEQPSALGLLRSRKDWHMVRETLVSAPDGSSCNVMYADRRHLETLLEAVPEVFPYFWRPVFKNGAITNWTVEQGEVYAQIASDPLPRVTIDDVALVIERASLILHPQPTLDF